MIWPRITRAVVNHEATVRATTIVQKLTVPKIASVRIANGRYVVDPAPEESGDRAVDDADAHDRDRGGEADLDRDAAAERRAHEEVAAELIRAERVIPARPEVGRGEVEGIRVLRAEPRREDHEADQHEEGERCHQRAAVLGEAVEGVAPQRRALEGGPRLSLARLGRAEEGGFEFGPPAIGDHQVLTSRVRGSR
jgi:hypothetical protein